MRQGITYIRFHQPTIRRAHPHHGLSDDSAPRHVGATPRDLGSADHDGGLPARTHPCRADSFGALPADPGRWPFPVPDPPAVFVRSHVRGRWTVISLHGELDLAAVPEAEAHLMPAVKRPGARVAVDLRPTDFIDCVALRLLADAAREAGERGGELRLVCVRPHHLRLFRLTGLAGVLRPAPTLGEVCDDPPSAT
ncbi:STAS domain-containing protein [Streptomyces sp. NPDC003077]|uniref:STAS domain-containing protein n=1 Tax=Streptomyces sp. NPDC003077 TaxID=3154443 RepID=UPI0033BE39A8